MGPLDSSVGYVCILMQLFRAEILNVRAVFMVGVVEEHFIQASPIKDFGTFRAVGEVLLFFGWQLFVFVGCHSFALAHSLRLASSKAITRSTLPVESKIDPCLR
jgi:hypothetical protein